MNRTEFLNIVTAGANVTADARSFTLADLRQIARAAARSGATLTVTRAHFFDASELHMIAAEGGTHVTFPDIRVED